jgi:hypothetical protein
MNSIFVIILAFTFIFFGLTTEALGFIPGAFVFLLNEKV